MTPPGRIVVVEGLDDVRRKLGEITKELRAAGASTTDTPNSELRRASKEIAEELIPVLRSSARGTPQAAGIAATARAKSDRIVRVSLGTVNPPWASWGRGRSAAARTAVAFGSNYGPRGSVNYYQASRNDAGYYVEPAVKRAEDNAMERYKAALIRIARKYGAL